MNKIKRRILAISSQYWTILLIIGFIIFGIMWLKKLKNSQILSPEDFISNIILVIGWLVALLMGLIHLEKIRKDNQNIKREEIKKSIEREAFREINRATTQLSGIISKISVSFIMLPHQLNSYIQNPILFPFDKEKIKTNLNTGNIDLLHGLTEFLLAIESNEIAVIKFDHWRKFIHFRVEEACKTINNFYENFVNIGEKELITQEKRDWLKQKCDEVYDRLLDIQSYLYDYRIELMNSLLGKIFNATIPIRKPRDPKHKILTEVAIKKSVEKEEDERENKALRGEPLI
ncbi:hypothetical protein KAW65_01985 [candidate division WOR-3 bacterium]|nr:hypothetical protein [candidate division WOR-3 bacterium]